MPDGTIRVQADLRWPTGTGIGVVQRELLTRIPRGISIVDLAIRSSLGNPLQPALVSLAQWLRGQADVFWSPGFIPPLPTRMPAVVTVHDLTHLHYYSQLHANYYNTVLRPLYRQCTAIICVSEFTRSEFLNWSGMPEGRVHLIHNGTGAVATTNTLVLGTGGQPYVFYPGNRRGYKNLYGMIQAYAKSRLPREGILFLITGNPDVEVLRCAETFGVTDKVQCVGALSQSALAGYYSGALMIAFASLYEGFGLPILEGMAAGIPVLTSNVTAMPEISGGAAYLVNPTSVEQMTQAFEVLAFDTATRERLIEAGRRRIGDFSWDRSASRLWQLVSSVARRSNA